MLYVGIDVHKRYCQAAFMNEHGIMLREVKFENTNKAARTLAETARRLDPNVKAVVEPSANYWIKVYDRLEEEGIDIRLSNPSKTKAIASAKIKSDKLDAETLATLLKGDLVAESYVPTKENRTRRSLIRHKASLMKIRVELKNRIHGLLDKYDETYNGTDLFGKEGLEWLRSRNILQHDRLILDGNLRILEAVNEQIKAVDIQIAKEAVNEDQVKLLMTMPGVDYYSAMIILSEIGDVKRFPDPGRLTAWAGLVPSLHQSGEKEWTGRITKRGSRRLRWILTQCAHTARQHDPKMKAFYERIARRHGEVKAIIAVARKMLSIMHVMLTRDEAYSGENPQLTEAKHKRLARIANHA